MSRALQRLEDSIQVYHIAIEALEMPMLFNKIPIRVIQGMEDTQTGKSESKKRKLRDPHLEYWQSMWHLKDGQEESLIHAPDNIYGLPAHYIKASMVEGAKTYTGNNKKINGASIKRTLFVKGDYDFEYCVLHGIPEMHRSPVKVGKGLNKAMDLRYRAMFRSWKASFYLECPKGVFSDDEIYNLIADSGKAAGLGDFRVGGGGFYGRYKVADAGFSKLTVQTEDTQKAA